MIGLFKAIRDYDAGRDASFYTFADLCISRQMYTAVQASRREKHAPLNSYISLYANLAENEQEENESADTALVNRLTSGTDTNPEAVSYTHLISYTRLCWNWWMVSTDL